MNKLDPKLQKALQDYLEGRRSYSEGEVRGRPGMVLAPSKKNPKVKRWQVISHPEHVMKVARGAIGVGAVTLALIKGTSPKVVRERLDGATQALEEAIERHKKMGNTKAVKRLQRWVKRLQRAHEAVDYFEALHRGVGGKGFEGKRR